jgi:dipeptidyl aminopeptidase/acylaminoacyl peptidase
MRVTSFGALLICGLPIAAVAAPPPVTAFTNYAQYESATISPGGTYLAITRRTEQNEGLTILTLPDLKLSGQTYFGDLTDIELVEWANDERLLVQPERRFPGYTAAKVPTGEIIGVNADAKAAQLLFGFAAGKQQTGTRLKQRESVNAPARLIGRIPGDPRGALIQTYGYSMEGDFNSAYRMDVRSGDLRRLAISPVRDGTFVTDANQNIVFVHGRDREGGLKLFHRPAAGGDWKLIATGSSQGGYFLPFAPWGKDGEFLAYDNRDAPTDGVFSFMPGAEGSKLLFRKPEVDVRAARYDPQGRAYMLIYDDHFPNFWYPDPEHPLAQAHQWLRTTLRGHHVDISSVTDDMSFAIVRVTSPRNPLMFFYFDVKNRKLLVSLAAYPDLKPEDLADVEPFEVKARDGLQMRGYLTVPNVPVKKKLPTIVMVHGGPHGVFDTWGFDSEAQLFASRGYAVLQVNYRGSAGRGREFLAAGYREWGGKMQDDVTDAVQWAIKDGVTDASRICIYGASYGAYSALTGAFRDPQMFRCAVGMAGVYDLPMMFDRGDIQTVKWGVNYLSETLGGDMEELKRRSPVYNAEKIRAPVLLIHGKDDERAPYEHAVRMRAALVKAGNAPEWLTESLEGHGFGEERNRAEAYEKMLAFFAKHLGQGVATSAASAK